MNPADVSDHNLARARDILECNPSVDLHSHFGMWENKGLDPSGAGDSASAYIGDDKLKRNIETMISGGCKCAYLNITSDVPIIRFGVPGNRSRDFEGDEAWEEYQRQMGVLNDLLRTMPMALATGSDDIERIFATGRVAVFLTTEGAHMVERDLGRIERLRQDGILRFQPCHYARTKLGDNQTDGARYGGLTDLGRAAVKEAHQQGMIIDAAHASFATTSQMADLTAGPIVLSHTMMRSDASGVGSRGYDHPRFISKDHALLIARTGGVIGTWPKAPPIGGTVSAEAFVEGVMEMAAAVGIDHVGWATDYVDRGAPPYFPDFSSFPALCGLFLERGFSAPDLIKFIGANAIRVHEEIVGH